MSIPSYKSNSGNWCWSSLIVECSAKLYRYMHFHWKPRPRNGILAHGARKRKMVIYIGIVDLLTQFDAKRLVEYAYKRQTRGVSLCLIRTRTISLFFKLNINKLIVAFGNRMAYLFSYPKNMLDVFTISWLLWCFIQCRRPTCNIVSAPIKVDHNQLWPP